LGIEQVRLEDLPTAINASINRPSSTRPVAALDC